MSDAERNSRTQQYRVDDSDLRFLSDLNESLLPFESRLSRDVSPGELPVVIIGGLQRSGTTLLYQLLACCCEIGYVSNLMARFWRAPLVGAKLARMLLSEAQGASFDWSSRYGVTEGPWGPHEFGYFWTQRLRLDSAATHLLSDDEASRVDWSGLMRCLRQITTLFGMPLVLKNPVACLNAKRLFPHFSGLRLVVLRRDPFSVVQSTYLSRKERYGDATHWWSLKPPSFPQIQQEPDPIRQIVAQVRECQQICDGLAAAYPSRCVVVDYQDVRRHAEKVVRDLSSFCDLTVREGVDFPSAEDLPDGDLRKVSAEEAKRIEEALAD